MDSGHIDTGYVRALRSALGGNFNLQTQEDAMEFLSILASKCETEAKTAGSRKSSSQDSGGECSCCTVECLF